MNTIPQNHTILFEFLVNYVKLMWKKSIPIKLQIIEEQTGSYIFLFKLTF